MTSNSSAGSKQATSENLTKSSPNSGQIWSEEEKEIMVDNLKIYGKNWQKLQTLVPSKTIAQVKNFFMNYKKKFKLDRIIPLTIEVPKIHDKEEHNKSLSKSKI